MSELPPDRPRAPIRKASGEIDYAALAVLVLDDNAFFGRLVQQILRGVGTQTISLCTHPDEAFGLLVTNRYNLVLTEALIGAFDGLDFVRRIRASGGTAFQQIPIIMVTAHTDAAKVRNMRDIGVTEILAKPISPATLLSRIELVYAAPRPFVKREEYTGPDRRRRRGTFDGDDRRDRNEPPEK